MQVVFEPVAGDDLRRTGANPIYRIEGARAGPHRADASLPRIDALLGARLRTLNEAAGCGNYTANNPGDLANISGHGVSMSSGIALPWSKASRTARSQVKCQR